MRIKTELELLTHIREDLRMRGEEDGEGVTVIGLSSSLWNALNEKILKLEIELSSSKRS